MKRMSRWSRAVVGWSLACVAAMALIQITLWIAAHHSSSTTSWRWKTKIDGVQLSIPVDTTLRAATTPLAGKLLNGRSLHTRYGVIRFAWLNDTRRMQLRCAPCHIDVPSLSTQPLRLAQVVVDVTRADDVLSGEVEIGAVRAHWSAVLDETRLTVDITLPETPVAAIYGAFGSDIPETAVASIDGFVAGTMTWTLPSGARQLDIVSRDLRVAGLGTEQLRGAVPPHAATSSITATASPPSSALQRAPTKTAVTGRDYLRRAVIAAEDQHFYEHAGYDLTAITDSFSANVDHGGIQFGGSTLSQQLAKILFVGDERSHVRKLRELLYAIEMERTLGKAQILDLYLATARWGRNVIGADAAARRYFHKRVDALTVSEAAWLAALLRNPERTRANPEFHRERSRWIITGMRKLSSGQRAIAMRELAKLRIGGAASAPSAWKQTPR